jgi:two-component system, OmpR family, response regulator VicR
MRVPTILIIEDFPEITEAITLSFRIRWPEARIVSSASGAAGVEMAETEAPDVVILDLGLPDISGFDVIKGIRRFSAVPILVLTVRSEETSIVKALESGADDYVVKPFKQLELLARVQALIRRQMANPDAELSVGDLKFNTANQVLYKGANEINVTRTEGLILAQLMRNAGNVVTHSSLADAIWGSDYPDAEKSIKVHIRRLREKLEDDPGKPRLIQTKPGMGYFLNKTA